MKLNKIITYSLFVGLTSCATINSKETQLQLEDFSLHYQFRPSVSDTTFTIFYRDKNENKKIDLKEIVGIKPRRLSKEEAYDLYLKIKDFK
jgi:hypothetical protein